MNRLVVPARGVGRYLLVYALAQAIFLAGVLHGNDAPAAVWWWCALVPVITALSGLSFFLPAEPPIRHPSTKD